MQRDHRHRTDHYPLRYLCTPPLWTTIMNHIRPRPLLHFHLLTGTLQTLPSWTEYQHSIPPINRWPVWTHQPMAQTIPLDFQQLPTEQLGTLATFGTIYPQLLAKCHHKENTIWTHHETLSTHTPTDPCLHILISNRPAPTDKGSLPASQRGHQTSPGTDCYNPFLGPTNCVHGRAERIWQRRHLSIGTHACGVRRRKRRELGARAR